MQSVGLSSTSNSIRNQRLCRFSRAIDRTPPPKRVVFVSSASSIKSDFKINANAAPAVISSVSSTFSGWFSLQNNKMISSLAKCMLTMDSNQSSNQVDCEYQGEEEEEEEEAEAEEEEQFVSRLETVVKVICRTEEPIFSRPWRKKQGYAYGTGFIVEGRRVLTCAHCVNHHIRVNLKKQESNTLYTARVLVIAPECDIAVLTVDGDEFWEGVMPVVFGGIPSDNDKLNVLGYHHSAAYHYLSRSHYSVYGVDMLFCEHREMMIEDDIPPYLGTRLLALEVADKLYPGESGGPAFDMEGKCVGMVLELFSYRFMIIPVPVIKHVIQDYDRNGAYSGFPNLGIKWQCMMSPDLRMLMNMKSDQQGVLITEVKSDCPESEIFMRNDVVLSIDGITIGNDGTVPFTRGRRIEFSYLLTQKYNGEEIVIKVLRNSEIHEFSIKLATNKQFRASSSYGRPLSYYIVAGFVFINHSIPYLRYLLRRRMRCISEDEFSQALCEGVVISEILKADINKGYDKKDLVEQRVLTLNGKPILDLKTMVEMVETCSEELLQFVLENHKVVVLQTNDARARTPDILKMHCIGSAMSDDLVKEVPLALGGE